MAGNELYQTRVRRFFVEKIEKRMTLTGDDHHHLALVLRAKPGESIVLCPQDGFDYEAVIEKIEKTETSLRVIAKRLNELEPSVDATLFAALLKGDKMDYVVQKVTELGFNRVVPFRTEFVQVRPESVRPERLNRIAAEAAKQCGRGRVPTVERVLGFSELTALLSGYDLVLFPYERAVAPDLKSYLRGRSGKKVAVVIGSEGGFSASEAETLLSCGVTPVTLGKRILRAETACVAVSAALMYELEQWV